MNPRRSLGDQAVSDDLLERLEIRFRELLGEDVVRFSQEDIFEAPVARDEQVFAVSEALPARRARLTPYRSECATDGDLRQAARRPHTALYASEACRLQVLRRRDVPEPYYFDSKSLGRRNRRRLGKRIRDNALSAAVL